MATYVLFWNPEISSFKMEGYRAFLREKPIYYEFDWSIWEHEKAEKGDSFVMVRCKNRPVPGKLNQYGKQLWEPCLGNTTGICMTGKFSSDPYEGKDWSGKGRETYYVNLNIEHMSDPDECVILSTAELAEAIPDFKWVGGASGRLLDEASAEKLKAMVETAVGAKKKHIWSPFK